MKYIDNGCFYTVRCSVDDVRNFKALWPCSGIPDRAIWFQFDGRNGDLVDMSPGTERFDGPALAALSQDAQTYGRAKRGQEAERRLDKPS